MRQLLNAGLKIVLVSCLIGAIGCSRGTSPDAGSKQTSGHSHSHSHGGHAHGPHGGHIVEFDTDDYHAEISQDDESQTVGIYVLDADGSEVTALPVASTTVSLIVAIDEEPAEFQLEATPSPGDGDGKSSYFQLKSEPLWKAVAGVIELKRPPELKLTIGDKTFTGAIRDEHAVEQMLAHTHHSHDEGEPLVWHQKLSESGYDIELGHYGVSLLAGGDVEPAVQVTHDGEPTADAKVFSTLLSAEGAILAEEVAAVYESPTEAEPAHYAKAMLKIPPGTREAKIHFRIILPDEGGEKSFDVPVAVK